MITKAKLQSMREDALQSEVLKPLLELMGHKDVYVYHGGVEEQGKDIVSWKPNDLGRRTYFAFVVKAIPITGQANTRRGSAGEVFMQIQQCFGEGFRDPITLEEHTIHECWVITNKAISTEAHRSLRSALKAANRDQYVNLIDIDQLWQLVERFMPQARTLQQQLTEIKQVFDEADPYYRPTLQMTGSEVTLGLEPKFPGTTQEAHPDMGFTVTIPATPEHEPLIESMNQAIQTGSPVEIPSEYVRLRLPEVFTKLLGTEFTSLRIGPVYRKDSFPARMEFETAEGDSFVLEYVHFKPTQVGTDEITFTNADQPGPIHLTLIIRLKVHEATLHFQFAPLPMNVHQFAQILGLQSIAGRGCKLRIISLDAGLKVLESYLSPGLFDLEPGIVEEVEDLDAIQQKTQQLITLPAREITEDEFKAVAELRTILHNGEVYGTWQGTGTTIVGARDAESMLKFLEKEGSILLRESGEASESLFGTTIPLGPVVITRRGVILTNKADVLAKLAESPEEEAGIPFEFASLPDATVVAQYPNWGATIVEWRVEDEDEQGTSSPT